MLNDDWRSYAFWTLVAVTLLYMSLPAIVVIMASFNRGEVLSFPPTDLSLRWYAKALTHPDFQIAFRNGVIVAAIASSLALIFGSAVALLLSRYQFKGRGVLEMVLAAPLIVPHFTTGFGFLLLGAHLNLNQTYLIIVVAHVVLVLPFVTRTLYVSLQNIDPNLELAAANLGASPIKCLGRVTLPLMLPGMVGGWLVAAILSLTEFSASLYVTASRTQTLPVAMYNYIREYTDPTIAAISALLIITTTLIMIAANHFIGLRKILAIGSK